MYKWVLRFVSIGFAVAAGICFSVSAEQVGSSPGMVKSAPASVSR